MTHYHSIHLACPQAVCGDIGIVVTLEVCKSVEAVWTSAGKGVLAGEVTHLWLPCCLHR